MNRTLRSVLGVCIASVALAAALNFVIPQRGKAVSVEREAPLIEQFTSGVRDVLPVALEAIASAVDQVQVWTGMAPAPGYDQDVVMLKEPVVILHGGDDMLPLAKGTPLSLVKRDGAYLRVEHGKRVITIPRNAAVSGTFHGR